MCKKLSISEKCVAEKLDKNLIILNIETGEYHELNVFGTFIWEKIEENNPSRAQLVRIINSELKTKKVDLDLNSFLQSLLDRQLLMEI